MTFGLCMLFVVDLSRLSQAWSYCDYKYNDEEKEAMFVVAIDIGKPFHVSNALLL